MLNFPDLEFLGPDFNLRKALGICFQGFLKFAGRLIKRSSAPRWSGERKSMPSGGQILRSLPGTRNLDDFSCLVAKKSVLVAPIFYRKI